MSYAMGKEQIPLNQDELALGKTMFPASQLQSGYGEKDK